MDDGKKKRRNRKKKNKQQANNNSNNNNDNNSNDNYVTAGESTSIDQEGRVSGKVQNANGQVLNQSGAKDDVMHNLEKQPLTVVEGASLEEELEQLQNEKQAYEEREDALKEKIVQLKMEVESCIQKEVHREEEVRQMQMEKESLLHKVQELEMRIKELQSEKQSWLQKEAGLEEKINQLVDETASLNLKGVSLEEKIKRMERERGSWVQDESTRKETIMRLDGDNIKLQAEDTSENGDVNSETDAAGMLVDKLIGENAELVEKVSESAQRNETGQDAEVILDSSTRVSSPGERLQSTEEVVIKDEGTVGDYLNAKNSMLLQDSFEEIESDKIVQIPLDENEIEVVNSEAAYSEEKPDVPLTDAPLIGAPFRLISFVARYVSGADLVNKSAAP